MHQLAASHPSPPLVHGSGRQSLATRAMHVRDSVLLTTCPSQMECVTQPQWIVRYLRGVRLAKSDVYELAMNLAAEKAMLCEGDSDSANCVFPADHQGNGVFVALSLTAKLVGCSLLRTETSTQTCLFGQEKSNGGSLPIPLILLCWR